MSNQYIIKTCDRLCYDLLLIRDVKCQRCESMENLVPSHCYGKKAWPTLRHVLDNQLLLCDDCHKWWHRCPLTAWDWFRTRLPERNDKLITLKWVRVKLNKIHYQDTREILHAELKRLESDWGDLDPDGDNLPF